jgi:hypothetical protein
MSIRTTITALAVFAAAVGMPALAAAQSAYTNRADYYAGAPGPYRPHYATPGDAFGFSRGPARAPAPYMRDSGPYQGSTSSPLQQY